jgi:hypothetical protein
MPGWLKIVLAVVAVFILVMIGFGVTGYLYVKQHKDEWMKAGSAAKKEGEAFADGKEVAQCVDEAVSRVGKCDGLPCEIAVRLFLTGCTAKAAPSPQICTNMPPRSEMMRSVRWSMDECNRRGLPKSQPCARLLQEVQRYCANQK